MKIILTESQVGSLRERIWAHIQKGEGSKFNWADGDLEKADKITVPLSKLKFNQPKEDEEEKEYQDKVDGIIKYYKKHKKLMPMLVHKIKGGYRIIDGHHRYTALKQMGIKNAKVIVVPAKDVKYKKKLKLSESEVMGFDNWVMPSMEDLQREYKIEHEMKGLEAFDSLEDFLSAVSEGEVVTITPEEDDEIGNRSQTSDQESLMRLIKGYRSYPEFRNEETVQAIYDGFKNNNPMILPIVIEYADGEREILSGNTRMDIAYQLNITPKVLLIHSEQELW